VTEGNRNAGLATRSLDPSGAWTHLNATADIGENSEEVTLALRNYSEGARVQFDDFSVQVTAPPHAARDPVFTLTVLNPSAEQAAVALRPALARRLPLVATEMIDVLVNPQPFDKLELWKYYAVMQHRSFWGNFGWLSVPLPDTLFLLIAIIMALALAGLIVWAIRRWGNWSAGEWAGLVSLAALAVAIFGGFLRETIAVVVLATTAYLHGRYLFVLIIPIIWLLLAGAWAIASPRSKVQSPTKRTWTLGWAVWLWTCALFIFAVYCLVALLTPYYYG
jgi:hypothetical protein